MAHGRSAAPGDVVVIRRQRWRLVDVHPGDRCTLLRVAGSEASNRGHDSYFLAPFESIARAGARSQRPRLTRLSRVRHVLRRALADAAPSWSSLRAAASADIALLPFQLEPALALARGDGCRVLLADDVGLGKTIQAGLMAADLRARDRESRVLIVVPAVLRGQWKEQLEARFGLDAEVFDAGSLARTGRRLPSNVNPWAVAPLIVTSIDFVKRPDVIRSLEPMVWDLVVFDEAHALAGRTDRAHAADLLARRARRLVLVTATPHSGDEPAFKRLCALGSLDGDPLLVFRRTRADVGLATRRRAHLFKVTPTVAEAAMHRALAAYAGHVWRHAPVATVAAARLAMIVLGRRAASSAGALATSVERRMALIEEGADAASQLHLPLGDDALDDDETAGELGAPGMASSGEERRRLARILQLARAASHAESKIRALVRLLRRSHEPVIVFTEYRDTLAQVARALPADCEIATLHGGLSTADRQREVSRFTRGSATVLLATDAASEGLNLHHRCRLVINLEIPWMPRRLEQRIGRVDRLGQSRPVHAMALVARGTLEETVVARFRERVLAMRALGGLAFGGDAPPAGGPSAELPHGAVRADLRPEAVAEASRLAGCRLMAAGRHRSSGPPRRPPLATSRRTGRSATACWVLRLCFVDADGAEIWQTVAALTERIGSDPGPVCPRHPIACAAAAAHVHAALLERLKQETTTGTARLLARDRAIVIGLGAHGGRLAHPLLQPGIFDRRAIRLAEAQRRLLEEAVRRAEEASVRWRRLCDPAAGERQLLAALVLR